MQQARIEHEPEALKQAQLISRLGHILLVPQNAAMMLAEKVVK